MRNDVNLGLYFIQKIYTFIYTHVHKCDVFDFMVFGTISILISIKYSQWFMSTIIIFQIYLEYNSLPNGVFSFTREIKEHV